MSEYDINVEAKKQVFNKPWLILDGQDNFGEREVGLKHPDNESFIRLRVNGDVEIGSGNSVAMVLSGRNQSITMFADKIKLITSHEQGLRWNDLYFNEKAHNYQEPTFLDVDDFHDGFDIYEGVDYYLEAADAEPDQLEQAEDVVNLIRNAINLKRERYV